MAHKFDIDRKEYALSLLDRLEEMRKEKDLCDFIIKVGSEEIEVHRTVLSAASDYFKAMLSHDTKEKKSGLVEYKDFDVESIKICVDHIYGREVSVPVEKYEQMIYISDLMQLRFLRDGVLTLAEANLTPKTFFATKRISDLYGYKELEKKCVKFAEENFVDISKEEEFGELKRNYIKKIIKSENVKMTEDEKLDTLLRWVKHDGERSELLSEMIKWINLDHVSVEHLEYVMDNDQLISENLQLFKIFTNSLEIWREKTKDIQAAVGSEAGSAISIFDRAPDHLQCFNPRDNTLTEMQAMNDDMKSHFSAVSLDDHIYVLTWNKSVYRLKYADEAATWEKMASIIEDHGPCPPATVLMGNIYVLGNSCPESKTGEKYDPIENKWRRLKDKPQPSRASTILGYNGYIYSFGGYTNNQATNIVQRSHVSSSTWSDLPSMKYARAWAAAVEVIGNIYVVGGSIVGAAVINMVECFDTRSNLWFVMQPMKIARSAHKAFAMDGSIYAVGGNRSSNSAYLKSIEKYDVERNQWELIDSCGENAVKIYESVKIKLNS